MAEPPLRERRRRARRSLHLLPLDALEIDRRFVERVDVPGTGEGIVKAVVALGEAVGCEVAAEGVERLAQLRAVLEAALPPWNDLLAG